MKHGFSRRSARRSLADQVMLNIVTDTRGDSSTLFFFHRCTLASANFLWLLS